MRKLITIAISWIILIGLTSCAIEPPVAEATPTGSALTTDVPVTADPSNTSAEDQQITFLVPERQYGWLVKNKISPYTHDLDIQVISGLQDERMISADEIIPRFLSNDKSFDLYWLSSRADYITNLLEKGYYVDLSSHQDIAEAVNHMFPTIQNSCMYNNEIFGVPVYIDLNGFIVEQQGQLDKIGWTIDQLQTVDDLYAFDSIWSASDQDKDSIAIHPRYIMDQFILRYIYNHYDYSQMHVDLTTSEFQTTLETSLELLTSHLVNEDYVVDRSAYKYALFGTPMINTYDTSNYCPMPQIPGHDEKNVVFIDSLAINPNSEHIELAKNILHLYTEFHKGESIGFGLIPVYSTPSFYEELDIDLSKISSESMVVNDDYMDKIGHFYRQYQYFFAIPGEERIREIFSSYLDGDIAMDAAIAEAQQLIDMISSEHIVAG